MIRIVGVKITTGTEVTLSALLGLKGFSDSLAAGTAPKAADGGCFPQCAALGNGVWGQWSKPAVITPWHP